MVLKLVPVGAVMLLGSWVLASEPDLLYADRSGPAISSSGIMTAATISLFAMLGFESASIPSDRVAAPARTIPRATMTGTLLLGVVYISVSAVIILLVPRDVLESSRAPFADLFGQFVSGDLDRIVALFIVASGLGALNGWVLLVGELTRCMATRGTLPVPLSRVNRYGAPAHALIVTGLLSSAVVLLNVSESLVEVFTVLSLLVTATSLPLYLFCALALLVLRRRKRLDSDGELVVVGALGAVYAIYTLIGVGAESALLAAVLAVIGIPLFLRTRSRRGVAHVEDRRGRTEQN
jgi:APA family basic amino acid/polyamine antiporter